MNAKQAEQLALSNQNRYEKRKNRRTRRNINFIHYEINRKSKKGYFAIRWDYRDSLDRDRVKQILIDDGYQVKEYYPYFEITWGDENEINHKKFLK